ncbi:MAG TPA: amidase [Polyangiaceae bacterium]|nr:amidase [Polyangiaceae bacterium]
MTQLVEALRQSSVSPVELMHAVLARADATHSALNALCARRDPEALLAEARAAEERIARGNGRSLEGIPFAVKDLEDAAGLPTTFGSRLFQDAVPAERDSLQVARLRAAGAILFGKTNAPEFGFTAITKNLVFGTTRSPWDRERSPGGSSGGSAALLAGEVMPLVTASDGGGSIRIPASFTGAFGVKPSYGRIPRGPSEFWDSLDTAVYGPITKTVADAALLLDVLSGPHALDAKSLPPAGVSYRESLRIKAQGLRIGLSLDLGYAPVQSDIAACIEDAARVFTTLGHRLEAVSGGPPEMGVEWGLLGAYQLGAEFGPRLAGREADVTRALLRGVEMARGLTRDWWGETARKRARVVEWCAALFDRCDVLLTPTVPFDPPPAGGPFPSEIDGRALPASSAGSFTIPFNLSWHPAATVRAGSSRAGLPVGMQIVVPRHREDLLLQLAHAFERERPWQHWPKAV